MLESPYREGNPMPEEIRPVSQQMNEFVEESYIEFYEMFEPQFQDVPAWFGGGRRHEDNPVPSEDML